MSKQGRVTVFGGAGFMGSHVADVLDASGYEVIIYDIRQSQYLSAGQKMVVGDILDQKTVENVVNGCDYVYNFAGIADIGQASEDPLEGVRCNILGNAIILEACRKAKVKRFVFASSLYVYSKAGSIYRSTKQACELLIENYRELFGLPYTILRFGSLYGPRADNRNIIYTMLTQALKEGKITRYGDGEELREYIHIHDAASGSVEILDEEFANQHIIITGNQRMRIKDLLYMVKEMFENKIELEFLPSDTNLHYEITPYTFAPKTGRRLTSHTYIDLGQGILETIHNLYNETQRQMSAGKDKS
ncbi:MAG: NAD-dependent epimerase/dehydratase family protein [Candidatus Magnetominusculus sp. LBB02]|nr:NAD-dependent epimerase/dehydratase family protein [Candidatus Magnetominusculus sp. LBB02]